ncbi:MAG: DoxX family protein [Gammaproteobacteria bacterium]|nr:DoxX family protein [Gammaproteobacteria bacterium]
MIDARFAPYAALVLRLGVGSMWISHALLKYLVFTLPGFAGFLASHGMPSFLAWPVFVLEIGGGVFILLGVYSRWAALLLIPILIGAASVHVANGWVFSNPGGGWEYPVFLIVASIAQGLLGDGALAIKRNPSMMSLTLQPRTQQ